MNREETLLILKAKLAEDLEKLGSSLLEFEDLLVKEANFGTDMAGDAVKGGMGALGKIISEFPGLALSGTLLAGTTAGGLAYAANHHMANQDKALNDKRLEVDRYKQLTDKIKADYNL